MTNKCGVNIDDVHRVCESTTCDMKIGEVQVRVLHNLSYKRHAEPKDVSNDNFKHKHSSVGTFIPSRSCHTIDFHLATVDVSLGPHDGPTVAQSCNLQVHKFAIQKDFKERSSGLLLLIASHVHSKLCMRQH